MSTSLKYILGAEGAAGNPGAVRRLAVQLRGVAESASTVEGRLHHLSASSWQGAAAREFEHLHRVEVPKEISKVQASFGRAGEVLERYAGRLQTIQDQGRALATQRDGAVAALAAAKSKQNAAAAAFGQARSARAGAMDPASLAKADVNVETTRASLSKASTSTQSASNAVGEIDKRSADLRSALAVAAQACADGLEAASNAGIRNSIRSRVERFGHESPLRFLPSAAWDAATGLPRSAAAEVRDDIRYRLNPTEENRDRLAESRLRFVATASGYTDAIALTALAAAGLAVATGAGAPLAIAAVMASKGAGVGGAYLDSVKLQEDQRLASRGKRTQAVVDADKAALEVDAAGFLIPVPGLRQSKKLSKSATGYAIKPGSRPQYQGATTRNIEHNQTRLVVETEVQAGVDYGAKPYVEGELASHQGTLRVVTAPPGQGSAPWLQVSVPASTTPLQVAR